MDQHCATHGDVERLRADLIERMGQLEVRLVDRINETEAKLSDRINQVETWLIDRIAQVEVRVERRIGDLEQGFTTQTRWIAGLFVGQTLVLLGAVPGVVEVLR